MDKRVFSSVMRFVKAKPMLIVGMVCAMLFITFGDQKVSEVLRDAELNAAYWGLGAIRLILQTALSAILVFVWHRDRKEAAPFAAVDILKLFLTTLFANAAIVGCMVIPPLGIWLYLRFDFYMNAYITGRSTGIFSCIGASFRMTKGKTARYLLFNLKYLLVLLAAGFAVTLLSEILRLPTEQSAMILSLIPGLSLPDGAGTVLNVAQLVFASLFMPYRILLKCGYYDEVLEG